MTVDLVEAGKGSVSVGDLGQSEAVEGVGCTLPVTEAEEEGRRHGDGEDGGWDQECVHDVMFESTRGTSVKIAASSVNQRPDQG